MCLLCDTARKSRQRLAASALAAAAHQCQRSGALATQAQQGHAARRGDGPAGDRADPAQRDPAARGGACGDA